VIEIKTKLRKWGNSFGIVVPQKAVEQAKVNEGEEIRAFILESKPVNLKKLWGAHKFKQTGDEIMREIDRELYDD